MPSRGVDVERRDGDRRLVRDQQRGGRQAHGRAVLLRVGDVDARLEAVALLAVLAGDEATAAVDRLPHRGREAAPVARLDDRELDATRLVDTDLGAATAAGPVADDDGEPPAVGRPARGTEAAARA